METKKGSLYYLSPEGRALTNEFLEIAKQRGSGPYDALEIMDKCGHLKLGFKELPNYLVGLEEAGYIKMGVDKGFAAPFEFELTENTK